MFFYVLLLSGLFNGIINSKNKNFDLFAKKNISSIVPLSIMLRELSNSLFRLSSNYSKLEIKKSKVTFTFWGLRDLDYIKEQSKS